MLSRYAWKYLPIALLVSASTACGQFGSSRPAEQPTAVSQEVAPTREALPAIDENPPSGSSRADIAPFKLPLDAPLPRGVAYASMDWSITEAVIDNTVISLFGSDKRTDDYRAARITLRIKNPLSRYASIDRDLVRLRLGDGKLYQPDDSTPVDLPEGNAETATKLAFRIPADATWQDAALVIGEAHKEPAELALEGPAPKQAFPAELPSGATATAQKTDYRVVSAALDLDYDGKRIAHGKRFLALTMRITFNGQPNLAVTNGNFRLLVDGAPMAPITSMIEVVDANSAKDGEVVFEVPASATKATLQVGEAGQGETAKIPLDLAATAGSR
jgi:hypothetical protein